MALNDDQVHALGLVTDHARNVFVTGCGGTGKSYWIHEVCRTLLRDRYGGDIEAFRNAVVLSAPTGVAATAIGGVTIHSAMGIGVPSTHDEFVARASYAQNRRRILLWDTLIIDEISMLSGEFVQQMDRTLRTVRSKRSLDPFGGVQIVCVGDFHQLAPIFKASTDPASVPKNQFLNYGYAFQAPAWRDARFVSVVFDHPFRQEGDSRFASLLNDIRHGGGDVAAAALADIALECRNGLRTRSPTGEGGGSSRDEIQPTQIFALNVDVDRINLQHLHRLDSPIHAFEAIDSVVGACKRSGETVSAFAARNRRYLEHEFFRNCMGVKSVQLALGAQVMLTKTVNFASGLVNGSRGVVVGIEGPSVGIEGPSGAVVVRFKSCTVSIAQKEFVHELSDGGVAVALRRTQVPLRLAWALTVHKSQGMTLDRVILSLRSMFAAGHAYVALSRARALDDLEILDLPQCEGDVLEWARGLLCVDHQLVKRFYEWLPRNRCGDPLPPPAAAYFFVSEGDEADGDGDGDDWVNTEWDEWNARRVERGG
jgi:ATP-dependent DNA helicase PIF1